MVRNQPESLRFYIRILLGLIGPCFELLLAFHTYMMPLKGVRLRRLCNQIALERGEEPGKAEDCDKIVPYAPPQASKIGVSMFENAVLTYKGHSMAGVVYSPARLENTISVIGKGPKKKSATVIFYGQDGEDMLKPIQQVRPNSAQTIADAECSTEGDADTLPSKPESGLGNAEQNGTELAFVVSKESASTLQLVPRVVPCEDAGHASDHEPQSQGTGVQETEVQSEDVQGLGLDDSCQSPFSQHVMSL
jgi:hypothetical protein